MNGGRRAPTGALSVAISGEQLSVARAGAHPDGPDAPWTMPFDLDSATRLDRLREAFAAIRSKAPDARALHIVLLPPLAEVRAIALPSLPADELLPALSRDIARYFPVGTSPQVVQVRRIVDANGAAGNSAATHLVSRADATLVDEILAAAEATGFVVGGIVPAAYAWTQAVDDPSGGKQPQVAVVRSGDREDHLVVGSGGLVAVRRLPAGAIATGAKAAAMRVLVRDADEGRRLAHRHANLPDELSLWPLRVFESRRQRIVRNTRLFAAAAVLMLVVAGLVEWSRLGRAADAIAAERARLRPLVDSTIQRRDSLRADLGVLDRIRGFEGESPEWLALLASIEAGLPGDASLQSLRAFGDTIVLIGDAVRAAPVVTALAQLQGLAEVRIDAPIQQQVEDGEVVSERFTIRAERRPGGSRR